MSIVEKKYFPGNIATLVGANDMLNAEFGAGAGEPVF